MTVSDIAIDANTILQADAVIIAGVLILLTIYSSTPTGLWKYSIKHGYKPEVEEVVERTLEKINAYIGIAVVLILVPFGGSAILLLSGEQDFAVLYMQLGFVYLIIMVLTLVAAPMLWRKKLSSKAAKSAPSWQNTKDIIKEGEKLQPAEYAIKEAEHVQLEPSKDKMSEELQKEKEAIQESETLQPMLEEDKMSEELQKEKEAIQESETYKVLPWEDGTRDED